MSPRVAAAVIAAVFFVVGLANIDQYGHTWDEQPVARRARLTEAYLRQAWTGGSVPSRQQLQAMIETTRADWHHPVMFATASRSVAAVARRAGLDPVPADHLLTLAVAACGVWFTFLLGRRAVGERAALAGTLLLALYPPLIAHAHYNPKDVPVMSLMTLALLALWRARERGRGDVAAALACASAVNTKLDGLAVFAIFGAALAAAGGWPGRAALWRGVRFFAWFALFTVVMWPMLLSDPLMPARSLVHWTTEFQVTQGQPVELYFGRSEPHAEHPWHYPLVWLFFSMAVPVAVLAVIGSVRVARRIVADPPQIADRFGPALLLAWLVVPVLPRVLTLMIVYNGMRHMFAAVPALMLIAGAGFAWTTRRLGRWPAAAAAAALALYLAVEAARLHPFQGSYVNEAARAVLGPELQERFHLDSWGAAYLQGMEWITTNARGPALVCTTRPQHVARVYARPPVEIGCGDGARYFMAGTGLKDECAAAPSLCESLRRDYHRVFEIRRMDSTLLFVAERNAHVGAAFRRP